jgi:hypothetical protein
MFVALLGVRLFLKTLSKTKKTIIFVKKYRNEAEFLSFIDRPRPKQPFSAFWRL